MSDEEIIRAKTQLKANLLMQLDSFSNIAEDIGRQLLTYGRRMTSAELFARVDAIRWILFITAKNVAANFISLGFLLYTLILPIIVDVDCTDIFFKIIGSRPSTDEFAVFLFVQPLNQN